MPGLWFKHGMGSTSNLTTALPASTSASTGGGVEEALCICFQLGGGWLTGG